MHSVVTPEQEEPVITYVRWPDSDTHTHVERAPTPGELEQAGHETLMRIIREAA